MTFISSRSGLVVWTPLALASAISAPSFAQSNQSNNEATLAPIVVTASRVEQAQTDALPHTTVITEQEIRNSQAVDVPTLLRREAGLQFTQNGGYGLASGLFVRGAETRQTLVLIDGIPLTKQDATGTVSIEHLMLDQVERIEIVRGNVSSIYGSGAVGGVIQIFTKRGEGPPRISASAEAGARDTTKLSAGVSGSSNGTHYALSASRFRTDGFSSVNNDQFVTANPDRDGYRNNSISGMLSQEFAKGHEAGLRFSRSEGRFDYDGRSSFNTPSDIHEGKTDVDTVSIFSKNRLTENWLSHISYSKSRDENANHTDTAFGMTDDRYQSKTRMLQWNNEVILSSDWTATAGYERQWQEFDSDNGFGTLFNTKRDMKSVYAGLQGKYDAHQWQFNLRHDETEKVDSATTGYVGYGYNATDALKLIANISTAFSVPPLGYLYSPFFGNPDLKPEKARSAEIGLQYATSAALWRATLFTTRVREQLQYDGSTFSNVARASNKGLELSATATWLNTDLRASLTLQDPRDETTDERLSRRARVLASLAANKSFDRWKVGGDLEYTGSRLDGDDRLGAYWIANLTSRYELQKGLSLYGRVENLFDRDYQTAYGYNQPPRGVFVGLSWQQ